MRWQISVKPPKDAPALEFKITRGSWEMCEVAADLKDISNRTLQKVDASKLEAGQQPTLDIEVEKFADQRADSQVKRTVDAYRTIKATGVVKRLSVVGGGGGGANLFREALVWLPSGYDEPANATRRYPVLYMMDGQNIFEQLPGVPGEWRADETATELIEAGKMEPVIIVGIPHAGAQRVSEYLPIAALGDVKPGGEAYVSFLVDEVVTRVERAFRTAPGAENRGIGGSSLGGLMSLYAGVKRPEVFGKVLAESPALILGRRDVGPELFSGVSQWPRRVSIAMGGKETGDAAGNEALVKSVRDLDARIEAAGATALHRRLMIDHEAVHTESAWAKRLPEALKFLFPPK